MMPYDVRPCQSSLWWSVYDTRTGEVVEVAGVVCDVMALEDAQDLADLLNWQEKEAERSPK